MQEKQTRLEQRNVAYLSNKDNFICFLKAPLDEISLNDWSKHSMMMESQLKAFFE